MSHGVRSLDRALSLLEQLALEPGSGSLAETARTLGLAPSTARRVASVLSRRGLLQRVARGRYVAGPHLARLAASRAGNRVLAETARPIARRLAFRLGATVHIGIFENEMITYIVKETCGADQILTKEGMQLEAYCTALGKMLLALLAKGEQERYLAAGPFIPLTGSTITSAEELRRELHSSADAGFAEDNGEIADSLACLAVPVPARREGQMMAHSVSWQGILNPHRRSLTALREAAIEIAAKLDG